METDAIRDYLATSEKAVLQTQVGAEALQAAVHQRWSVKTGADPEAQNLVGQAPTVTTIAQLCAIAVPALLPPDGRSAGAEETVYQLDATLIGYKHESDGDYHLVVADDHGNTMVAEIPDPAKLAPGSFFADLIAAARHTFEAQFAIKPDGSPGTGLDGPGSSIDQGNRIGDNPRPRLLRFRARPRRGSTECNRAPPCDTHLLRRIRPRQCHHRADHTVEQARGCSRDRRRRYVGWALEETDNNGCR